MGTKIIHVDDSSLVRKLVGMIIKADFPDLEMAQCDCIDDAKQVLTDNHLQKGDSFSLILTDLHMPGGTGYELLDWLKSHPNFHAIPVIVLSAESGKEGQQLAIQKGAATCLEKPFKSQIVSTAIKSYISLDDAETIQEMDDVFVEDTLEQLQEMQKIITEKQTDQLPLMMSKLHLLKGNSMIANWPIFARFVHKIEDAWSICSEKKQLSHPQLLALSEQCFSLLKKILGEIKEKTSHSIPPEELYKQIESLTQQTKDGTLTATAADVTTDAAKNSAIHTDSKSNISAPLNKQIENNPEQTNLTANLNNESLRIPRPKLDEVYAIIKKISQVRTRMSRYANQLKQEFAGEPFIRDLESMISDLGLETNNATDLFLKLRTREISRLLDITEKNVKVCADQLDKKIQFEVEANPSLMVDSAILQVLESLFGHLVRNSIDHGIESAVERLQKDKPAAGELFLKVEISKGETERDDNLSITFQDDGGGINFPGLRKKVASLNLLDSVTVNSMPDDQLIEYIFIDAVSTKEETTIFSGRGVGLALIKKTITDLNGSIKVETGLWGTRFHILIPRYFMV